jgi:hypothetical protein
MSDEPKPPQMQNVILTYDVYVVAAEGDAAIRAALDLVTAQPPDRILPSYSTARPMRVSPVRPQWQDERPIVADDVPDDVFEQLRGKTTQQAYEFLTKKQP